MNRMLLAGLVGLGLAAGCQEKKPVAAVRQAECRWARTPIQIDGEAKEEPWAQAMVIQDFAVFWQNRPARSATAARLLWDDTHLYFTAELQDADLYADLTERNAMIWNNDVFELFFKPHADRRLYYEFQVNAANAQLELFLPSRGAGGYARFAKSTKFGMESAVKLRGTLNQWEDQDQGWTVEGRIPWTAFAASGGKPRPGATWRFALCRYDYSAAFEDVETSSSAPLTQPSFHRYEDYGELTFVGLK